MTGKPNLESQQDFTTGSSFFQRGKQEGWCITPHLSADMSTMRYLYINCIHFLLSAQTLNAGFFNLSLSVEANQLIPHEDN